MRLTLPFDPTRLVSAMVARPAPPGPTASTVSTACDGSGTHMSTGCANRDGQVWCWCCHTRVTTTPERATVRINRHQRGVW